MLKYQFTYVLESTFQTVVCWHKWCGAKAITKKRNWYMDACYGAQVMFYWERRQQ